MNLTSDLRLPWGLGIDSQKSYNVNQKCKTNINSFILRVICHSGDNLHVNSIIYVQPKLTKQFDE